MASGAEHRPTADAGTGDRGSGALWAAAFFVAVEIAWIAALIVGAVFLFGAVT